MSEWDATRVATYPAAASSEIERLTKEVAHWKYDCGEAGKEARAEIERLTDHLRAVSEFFDGAPAMRNELDDLRKERDVLFKGDWAALNLKLEMAEAEIDRLRAELEERANLWCCTLEDREESLRYNHALWRKNEALREAGEALYEDLEEWERHSAAVLARWREVAGEK